MSGVFRFLFVFLCLLAASREKDLFYAIALEVVQDWTEVQFYNSTILQFSVEFYDSTILVSVAGPCGPFLCTS